MCQGGKDSLGRARRQQNRRRSCSKAARGRRCASRSRQRRLSVPRNGRYAHRKPLQLPLTTACTAIPKQRAGAYPPTPRMARHNDLPPREAICRRRLREDDLPESRGSEPRFGRGCIQLLLTDTRRQLRVTMAHCMSPLAWSSRMRVSRLDNEH